MMFAVREQLSEESNIPDSAAMIATRAISLFETLCTSWTYSLTKDFYSFFTGPISIISSNLVIINTCIADASGTLNRIIVEMGFCRKITNEY